MKLFETVALIVDLHEKKLRKGSVGTIMELLDDNNYLVEFADLNGFDVCHACNSSGSTFETLS